MDRRDTVHSHPGRRLFQEECAMPGKCSGVTTPLAIDRNSHRKSVGSVVDGCEFWNAQPVIFRRLARIFVPLAPGVLNKGDGSHFLRACFLPSAARAGNDSRPLYFVRIAVGRCTSAVRGASVYSSVVCLPSIGMLRTKRGSHDRPVSLRAIARQDRLCRRPTGHPVCELSVASEA